LVSFVYTISGMAVGGAVFEGYLGPIWLLEIKKFNDYTLSLMPYSSL
jgi:hypothetical protein